MSKLHKEEVARDRRKQILHAAVEVFAERGFHRTRVSDIAKRAGVAYGLVYHYFDSKDAVLNAVFESNWAVFLKVVNDLRNDLEKDALGRLEAVIHLLMDALEAAPAIVQVVIQEVSRSDRFGEAAKLGAFRDAFVAVGNIVRDGQEAGEIREDVDPMVCAQAILGGLETICAARLTEGLESSDTTNLVAKTSLSTLILNGLRPRDTE